MAYVGLILIIISIICVLYSGSICPGTSEACKQAHKRNTYIAYWWFFFLMPLGASIVGVATRY